MMEMLKVKGSVTAPRNPVKLSHPTGARLDRHAGLA